MSSTIHPLIRRRLGESGISPGEWRKLPNSVKNRFLNSNAVLLTQRRYLGQPKTRVRLFENPLPYLPETFDDSGT